MKIKKDLTLRSEKGDVLKHEELDANFWMVRKLLEALSDAGFQIVSIDAPENEPTDRNVNVSNVLRDVLASALDTPYEEGGLKEPLLGAIHRFIDDDSGKAHLISVVFSQLFIDDYKENTLSSIKSMLSRSSWLGDQVQNIIANKEGIGDAMQPILWTFFERNRGKIINEVDDVSTADLSGYPDGVAIVIFDRATKKTLTLYGGTLYNPDGTTYAS